MRLPQKGFSLNSLLMIMVVSSAVGYMVTQLIKISTKGTNKITAVGEMHDILGLIRNAFLSSAICKTALVDNAGAIATFDPSASPTSNLHSIKIGGGAIATINEARNNLRVSKIELKEVDALARVDLGATTRYLVQLKMSFTQERALAGGQKDFNIPLVLESDDATRIITHCNAMGASGGGSGTGGAPEVIIVHHETTGSTAGGSVTGGAWTRRTLNLIKLNEGSHIESLTNDVLTLTPGKYNCRITSTYFTIGYLATSRLVVDGTPHAYGLSARETSSNTVYSTIDTSFTLTANTPVHLEYYTSLNRSNDGLGTLDCGGCSNFNNNGPHVWAIFRCDVWQAN